MAIGYPPQWNNPLAVNAMGGQGFSSMPQMGGVGGVGANGVSGGGGMDKVTMAMMLMQALGTGFQAYSQAQTAKKDREFRQRQYDEGGDVRAEGRRRLLQPQQIPEIKNNDFFNNGQTLQGGVAAPPPPGPNAARDDELQRILRARLGGGY